ncbi:MAG: hypothetical protein H6Q66_2742 [Firmicutes bacterium]|nr:hypothetical protein [Bacillota bacterium]
MRAWFIQHRRLLTVLVVLIGLFSVSWYLFAARVGQALQDYLVERYSQEVNGRVQVGTVDLSIFGWVRVTDVSLYSKQGDLLAHVPVVKMQYSWSDLAKANFGISRIETITAEGAEIWLQEEKSHWNWENFIKEDQTTENKFQGKLQIVSAKIYGKAYLLSKTIDEASGVIDFHDYPDLDISLKGKIAQAGLTIDGDWSNGQFAMIAIKGKDFDLLDFRDAIPAAQGISLEGGKVTTLTMLIERDVNGVLKWQTEGEFAGAKLAGKLTVTDCQGQFNGNQDGIKLQNMSFVISNQQTAGQETQAWPQGQARIVASLFIERNDIGVVKWQTEGDFSGLKLAGKRNVTDGQGHFSGNQEEIQLQNMNFVISGQQTAGQGTLSWPQGVASIDAVLSVPDVDPGAFMSGLTVQRPVACRLRIVGPLSEPDISGSFSVPQATFSNMPVDRIVGNFRYVDTRLLLQEVSASVYQGTVGAAGEVQTSNESYEIDASGQGIDSSRLTDKDVQGPLDFNGHVSGKGEVAVTQGTFLIRDGKAYGIPFLKMTGHFVRRGAETEISGIAMETAAGTIYPEQLSREVLERLNPLKQPVFDEENIKKDVEKRGEESIKKEADKLLPGIFR